MAFEVEITPEDELGVVHLSAQVEGTGILAALNALYNGDTWAPRLHTVWDTRQIAELSVVPKEADQILDRMEALCHRIGEGRTVVIAPREVVGLFFRMLFARTTCYRRERTIVHDLDGAIAWLDELYPETAHALRNHMATAASPAEHDRTPMPERRRLRSLRPSPPRRSSDAPLDVAVEHEGAERKQ